MLIEFSLILLLLVLGIPLLGTYMFWVYEDTLPFYLNFIRKFENQFYKYLNINKDRQMDPYEYIKTLLLFNLTGFIFLLAILICQGWLPLNPQGFAGLNLHLAFNIAASFVTNTNWQSYAGETTLSYFSQMVGLTTQNFLSAATGMGALLVFIRGFVLKESRYVGNFWVDLTKTVLYILLPLSFILALILASQGVIANLNSYVTAIGLDGSTAILPMGPVASQEAIKQLGSNGGGFFNANSAHPFENPTFFTNFLEHYAILIIPAATLFFYGLMIKSMRQSMVILTVISAIWLGSVLFSYYLESVHNPILPYSPIVEGQDLRIGPFNSTLWSVSTTATSNGSTNAALSSLSPLAGGIMMLNIMMGEVIFGGVGVGLISILHFILLTVFLAGLMVGRTPEFLGKKIEKDEMKWVMGAILVPSVLILAGSSLTTTLPSALKSISQAGPHGLTELIYAFSSAAGNNGSAFAGIDANTPYWNITLGVVMLITRYFALVPAVLVGGFLSMKKKAPATSGTLPTDSWLFAILLLGVLIIVAALTFFPALALGPLIEQLLMLRGRTF